MVVATDYKKNLNKDDISKKIFLDIGISKSYSGKILNDIIQIIILNSNLKEKIKIKDFGTFTLRIKKERIGRNPRTGDAVNVSEKYIPRFKSGKELRIKLNSANKMGNTVSSVADTDIEL